MGSQKFLLLLLPLMLVSFHGEGRSLRHSRGSSQKLKINVKHYGAKGDGSDATKAFAEAWKEACSSHVPVVLIVPAKRKYLLKPLRFSGPCKSTVAIKIKGTIEASPYRSDWDGTDRRHWILFHGIKNLHVHGGGIINGNGKRWWKYSCKINNSLPCTVAPTAMTFYSCDNLKVENLRIKDSQQIHVSVEKCKDVKASNLTITAPEQSPNTDGIHITATNNFEIASCVIRTGDDCISIVDGSQKITVKNIVCGPGHGISIGSLGANHSEEHVSDVVVDTARFDRTTNGVRIKSWQGGHGHARNIAFRNIVMHNVTNPIIIDQNYCDSSDPCRPQESAVLVSNVEYKNIRGTSATEVAMRFDCGKKNSCHGILLQDINLVRAGGKKATKSLCNNVKLVKTGKIVPAPCA